MPTVAGKIDLVGIAIGIAASILLTAILQKVTNTKIKKLTVKATNNQ